MSYYTIYQTVNLLNEKKYVGFHKIKDLLDIRYIKSENGSIFEDGYMGSGKLIKQALCKYGPLNMSQELLLVTEDRAEAEALERQIVNRGWVDSEDTYNLSIGGNVTILFGEKNGFYGKKHSKETIEKILAAKADRMVNFPFSWCESYLVENPEIKFINKEEICKHFNIKNRKDVYGLVNDGVIRYKSEYLQSCAINSWKKLCDFREHAPERVEIKRKLVSERFKGKKKTPESNLKRGKSVSEWIRNNPELHKEKMDKINKNPVKIAKSAKSHTGQKRSEEARRNMSLAQRGKPSKNFGKIYIVNHENKERKLIRPGDSIPEGWVRGCKFR